MSKTSIIYKEILLYEEIGEHRKFNREYICKVIGQNMCFEWFFLI